MMECISFDGHCIRHHIGSRTTVKKLTAAVDMPTSGDRRNASRERGDDGITMGIRMWRGDTDEEVLLPLYPSWTC